MASRSTALRRSGRSIVSTVTPPAWATSIISSPYDPAMELSGKRALITGASRGIGEALAHAFAGAGATVALVPRSEKPLRKLAGDLDGTAHPTDLTDAAQVATLVNRVEDEAGPVDVLVNNAGFGAAGVFAEQAAEDVDSMIRLNL